MEMFPGNPNISQANSVKIWKNKALEEYLLFWFSQRVATVQQLETVWFHKGTHRSLQVASLPLQVVTNKTRRNNR